MEKKELRSNAETLLREYRDAILRKSTFEFMPGVGNNVLQACAEQLRFTQELVAKLRNHKLLGEKLYWIIFVSYMTAHQPKNIEEILSDIAQKYEHIPRRTYFRLKGRAISMMDEYLTKMATEKFAA